MREIEGLPQNEQERVFIMLAKKVIGTRTANPKQWLEKKLSFEDACDVVFRENRELLGALAK